MRTFQQRELSPAEIDCVTGGVLPAVVAGGAALAGAGYLYGNPAPSWGGFLTAAGTGALGAAMGGAPGAMVGLLGGWYAQEIDDGGGPDPAKLHQRR